MKKFEQLDPRDQVLLMTRLIKKFAQSGYLEKCHASVAQWARAEGRGAFDIWREVCADIGLDECAPWRGYPKGPNDLPDARGDRRPLPDEIAMLLGQIGSHRTH